VFAHVLVVVRMLRFSVALSGMMFSLLPACSAPMVSTALSSGEISRETIYPNPYPRPGKWCWNGAADTAIRSRANCQPGRWTCRVNP
jgi:hypothetical protein